MSHRHEPHCDTDPCTCGDECSMGRKHDILVTAENTTKDGGRLIERCLKCGMMWTVPVT